MVDQKTIYMYNEVFTYLPFYELVFQILFLSTCGNLSFRFAVLLSMVNTVINFNGDDTLALHLVHLTGTEIMLLKTSVSSSNF